MADDAFQERVRQTLSYHRRTKHHLHRYAASAGYLDWSNQPDPFRTYTGTPAIELPLLADAVDVSYGDLYIPDRIPPRRPDINTIAIFFELSLGISAWKEYQDSRWALRCNPSSGNLHPTEGYVVVPALPGLPAGVYHYVSHDHRLEQRCALETAAATKLFAGIPEGCFLVGLSSVHWREAWKYGERAFRYCQHDAGHALAAIRYAAATLGWSAVFLDHLGDGAIATLLGLDHDESFASVADLDREHPDAVLLVGPGARSPCTPAAEALSGLTWIGKANRLSREHVHWEVIDTVAQATLRPAAAPVEQPSLPSVPSLSVHPEIAAARLIRQRRSCLALDGHTSVDATTFFDMLDHLLPRSETPPWDAIPWRPHLHLAILVHHVRGLEPGLYLFERDVAVHDAIRAACRPEFVWSKPAGCPEHLRLWLLTPGDFRALAQRVCCHQEIASDGAFALGMIAEFGDAIREKGAWWYRRLFWESGVLGQVLYLDAEAAGVRGTGIGCYFDDAMHEILGLQGDRFQSLYHFTIGGPVEDRRLRTFAPYAHLSR